MTDAIATDTPSGTVKVPAAESPFASGGATDPLSPPVHAFPSTESPTVPVAVPSRLKVFIALCTRDWQSEAHNSESVRNIGRTCNAEIHVRYQMNDGVARSRNNLAAAFLESDCDILSFLDNDIIMETKHFDRTAIGPFSTSLPPVTLEETLKQIPVIVDGVRRAYAGGRRRGVVCCLYPKKQAILDWVVNYLPGEVPDEDGYLKVKHAGTGAMSISREALEDFIRKHPEIKYVGDPAPDAVRWDLFPMHATGPDSPGPQMERVRAILEKGEGDIAALIKETIKPTGVPGHYDSEDWKFCNMMRSAGWDIYVDTRSQLRHVGKIVFPLQFTLTDEEVVDIIVHRYQIYPDHVRTFLASGTKSPGLMGGHREAGVRHWPSDWKSIGDLHHGDVLGGCYDVPYHVEDGQAFDIIDIGADVGAFARWAAKRWPKCPIHCYESNPELVSCLNVTCERIAELQGVKPQVYLGAVWPKSVESLPSARVIKIDLPGQEREIIEALLAVGRVGDFDAIMIKYYDELTAYFLERVLAGTHFKHNHQRFAKENIGIVKFLRRETR